MNIDILSINLRSLSISNILSTPILNTLRIWSENAGWNANVITSSEDQVSGSTLAPVVAICVYTPSAPASYRVARRLRQMGKYVILGGPHFRGGMSAEADGLCDVVAETVSEEIWIHLLQNIESDRREQKEGSTAVIRDKDGAFRFPGDYRRSLQHKKWYQVAAIPTSLGCPYGCEFCDPIFGGKYMARDVEVIAGDLENMSGKTALFCDATFGLNKKWTMRLMERIASLGKDLLIETSLARMADRELVAALARGGVKAMEIGIETLSSGMNKHGVAKSPQMIMDAISMIRDHGIVVQGNFVLGLDSDGEECFDNACEFYLKSNLDFLNAMLLTPFPSTRLYRRLKEQGRILDFEWSRYDFSNVVFRPQNMSAERLHDGFHQLCADVHSSKSIARKVWRMAVDFGPGRQSALMTLYQLYYWSVVDKMLGSAGDRRPGGAPDTQAPLN